MENIEKLAEKFKAISDPTRLKLIKIISTSNSAMCVNGLKKILNISQSAVSQHLSILKRAGMVKAERRGNFVHYSIANEELDSIQQSEERDDLFSINRSGEFRFGKNFWSNQSKIKILEHHMEGFKKKAAEIEELIKELNSNNDL